MPFFYFRGWNSRIFQRRGGNFVEFHELISMEKEFPRKIINCLVEKGPFFFQRNSASLEFVKSTTYKQGISTLIPSRARN